MQDVLLAQLSLRLRMAAGVKELNVIGRAAAGFRATILSEFRPEAARAGSLANGHPGVPLSVSGVWIGQARVHRAGH